MASHLHIVSFDVPWPPDYGGIIDVCYKLKALHQKGLKIILHCFDYGRGPAPELEAWCEKVYYYPRKTGIGSNLSALPYNVRSRQSEALENNLLRDEHPILFEVLHTCYLLDDARFRNRLKIFRHSNIEHVYYSHLARSEKNLLKRAYLSVEARKLEKFEKILQHADLILAVNEEDAGYFSRKYPSARTLFVPSFHANESVQIRAKTKDYVLYHGNLSVSENYEAALWLIEHVFSHLPCPAVIAGLNPPYFLRERIGRYPHIRLIADPEEQHMHELIADASVHVLYTAQATGLKLKLLNVLFRGSRILCNSNMLRGTRFHEDKKAGLVVADTAAEFRNALGALLKSKEQPDKEKREELLRFYSNAENAERILGLF